MKPLIPYGLVTVTEVCNNDCSFCDVGLSRKGYKHRDPAQIRVQLGLMRDKGVKQVAFTGGEPTLHPAIVDLVRHAQELGFTTIRMYSHGRELERRGLFEPLLKAGLNQIMISLFGPNAEMHDRASGVAGSYPETLRGISLAAASGIHLVVNAPVTSVNQTALVDYLDVLDEVASPETIWQLSDLFPTTQVLREPEIHANYVELAPSLQDALTEATARGRKFLLQEFPLCVLFPFHTDAKEFGHWGRVMFEVADKRRPLGLWQSPPWTSPDRYYPAACKGCSVKSYCLGVAKSYRAAYGEKTPFIRRF
jgi:MoaA/NifB/PqqE/SkfB family radical SAM enzyme